MKGGSVISTTCVSFIFLGTFVKFLQYNGNHAVYFPGSQIDDGTYGPLRVEIFTLTMLRAGIKSVTHTYSALAKYESVQKWSYY